jgi:O-antigen ligase
VGILGLGYWGSRPKPSSKLASQVAMAQSYAASQPVLLDSPTRRAAGLGVLAIIGAALSLALASAPVPSPALLLAGGIAFCGLLALALARFDAAVALGFALLGVVRVEPAPPDLILMTVIAIAAVTGRFDLARVPRAAGAAVAVFCAVNVLTMIDVLAPRHAALFLSITLYLAVFSVWLSAYLNSERRARTLLIAYLFAALVSAVLAVLALYAPIPGKSLFLYDPSRAQALFKDPNVLGPFLIPPALILLQEILTPRLLQVRRTLKVLMFVVLSLGVLVSYSRAAWLNEGLGVVVVLLVTAMRRGGGRRALALLLTLIVGGAAVFEVAAITGSDAFINERASVQGYDTQRFDAQKEGIHLAEEHPLGLGPGQFDVYSSISAHSTYIRVLTEQGILGIATWLAIVLTTLLLAISNAVKGRDTYGIGSAPLLAAWCGLLLNSLVVDTLHWRHLWLVAALIWAGAMRRPSAPHAAQPGLASQP